ncbi:MAG: hypothetical protein ACREIV_15000 [Planctomycetaceae bacterium]
MFGTAGPPFGGVDASGYRRETGYEAIHEHTEAKPVRINVDARRTARSRAATADDHGMVDDHVDDIQPALVGYLIPKALARRILG